MKKKVVYGGWLSPHKSLYVLFNLIGLIAVVITGILLRNSEYRFIILSGVFVLFAFLSDILFLKIHKIFSLGSALYGIIIHITDPKFFVFPILFDIFVLFIFYIGGFGGGDFFTVVGLSVLIPNNAFFTIFYTAFAIEFTVALFLVFKKKRQKEISKVFFAFLGSTVFDGKEFIPFWIYGMAGYIVSVSIPYFRGFFII